MKRPKRPFDKTIQEYEKDKDQEIQKMEDFMTLALSPISDLETTGLSDTDFQSEAGISPSDRFKLEQMKKDLEQELLSQYGFCYRFCTVLEDDFQIYRPDWEEDLVDAMHHFAKEIDLLRRKIEKLDQKLKSDSLHSTDCYPHRNSWTSKKAKKD